MADCDSCQPENGFFINHPKLPGVPQGRVAIPQVRVNGQVQDMQPGMQYPVGLVPCNCPDGVAQVTAILTAGEGDAFNALVNALKAAGFDWSDPG